MLVIISDFYCDEEPTNQPEIVAVWDLEVLVDVVQVPLERLALKVLPQVEPLLNAEIEGEECQ